jgi:hypothetical protein
MQTVLEPLELSGEQQQRGVVDSVTPTRLWLPEFIHQRA